MINKCAVKIDKDDFVLVTQQDDKVCLSFV